MSARLTAFFKPAVKRTLSETASHSHLQSPVKKSCVERTVDVHAKHVAVGKQDNPAAEVVLEASVQSQVTFAAGVSATPAAGVPAETAAETDCAPSLRALLTDQSWAALATREAKQPYWRALEAFLQQEWRAKKVFPPREHIFRALNSVPVDRVRVVILGQDPYHGVGQAEGWSFSVPRGQKVPSSLQNIYKELREDVGFTPPRHGHLEHWVEQGVLLLNTSLSVEAHKANSHSKKGWERFTDAVISYLSAERADIVFLLWGRHAQERAPKIDAKKHLLLKSAHPSGLSASRGFFGCRHFSKCNDFLVSRGWAPIDWQLPLT